MQKVALPKCQPIFRGAGVISKWAIGTTHFIPETRKAHIQRRGGLRGLKASTDMVPRSYPSNKKLMCSAGNGVSRDTFFLPQNTNARLIPSKSFFFPTCTSFSICTLLFSFFAHLLSLLNNPLSLIMCPTQQNKACAQGSVC